MSFTDPDATAVVRAVLERYGLGELADWAWDRVAQGASPAEFELELREQPRYQQRFRAIFERERKGLPPISPEDVLEYEQRRRQVMRAYGFPEGFYDSPDDAVDGLVNDVSINEVEQRAALWVDYAGERGAAVSGELARWGITNGGLAAFLMDEDRALPLLQRQVGAADIAARARQSGFDLTLGEAMRVGDNLDDPAAATERFAALRDVAPALGDRLGDQQGGMSRSQMIGVAAADPNALRAAGRRVGRAAAAFDQDAGSAAATNRGIGGLGSAD